MNLIEKMQYDEERALYNATDCLIRECTFAGPADGESVLYCARVAVVGVEVVVPSVVCHEILTVYGAAKPLVRVVVGV